MKYDVVISFAGEDRNLARQINRELKTAGVSTFFDEDFQADLWGKNLTEELQDVFANRGTFCLMIISRHYIGKTWPRHERRAALSRFIRESRDFILPYFLDDTSPANVPGLSPDVGYLRSENVSPSRVAELVLAKLGKNEPLHDSFRREKCAQFILQRIHERLNPPPHARYFSPPYEMKLLVDYLDQLNETRSTDSGREYERRFRQVMAELLASGFICVADSGELGVVLHLTRTGEQLRKQIEHDRKSLDRSSKS